jgi:hypothetical protein
MPGAGYLQTAADGGELKGGAPRAVWQALGADPQAVSARSAAQRLDQLGRACHLVWNPLHGEIVQLVPIVRAARSLGCPEGLEQPGPAGHAEAGTAARPADDQPAGPPAAPPAAARPAEVNAEGRVCAQICVIAFAWEPFTSGPMFDLQAIMCWLDSWGVPRQWPAGRPPAFPLGHAAQRSRKLWARGGHFGASQVPGSMADGPGSVDVEMLTGRATSQVTEPRQAGQSTADGREASLAVLDGIFVPGQPADTVLTRIS